MSRRRVSRNDFIADSRGFRSLQHFRSILGHDFRNVISARINRPGPAQSPEEALTRQIHHLPSLASEFHEDLEPFVWSRTLVEILAGTRDEKSPLHLLRGLEDSCVRHIYSYIASEWAAHVTLTLPASCVGACGYSRTDSLCRFIRGRSYPEFSAKERVEGFPNLSSGPHGYVSFVSCGFVQFPEPTDLDVNMLPFVFGDKSSLPEQLQCYYDVIEKCPYMQEEVGRVGYLTVHESHVEAGNAQRRQGLHIESPGFFSDADPNSVAFAPGCEHPWGQGVFYEPDRFEGGIYMASSVSDTSEVWDSLVDKNVKGIVDRHGGCEHLRRLIGEGTKLQANELIWMTDCTPHQALPQETSGYRQFFRVVTSHISHWYADHSTPNPLVTIPDDVVVIHGSKFA